MILQVNTHKLEFAVSILGRILLMTQDLNDLYVIEGTPRDNREAAEYLFPL